MVNKVETGQIHTVDLCLSSLESLHRRTTLTTTDPVRTARDEWARHTHTGNFIVRGDGTTQIEQHHLIDGLEDDLRPHEITVGTFEADGFGFAAETRRLLVAAQTPGETHVQARDHATTCAVKQKQ